MTYKKVEGHDDLIRDMANGAIINKDTSGYRDYITLRNQKIKEQEPIDSIADEIGELTKPVPPSGSSRVMITVLSSEASCAG